MTDLAALLFEQDKLAAMGIADPRLAPSWGDSPDLGDTGAVSVSATLKAPFAGFVQPTPLVSLLDMSGLAMTAGGTTVEMHPAAYLALARLYRTLQAPADTALQRPVPRYAYLFAGSGAPTGAVRAGDSLGTGQTMTFHDARGWLIDAGAVAAAFAALMTTLPGLNAGSGSDLTSGLAALVGTTTAILVVACSPQGQGWSDPGDGHGIAVTMGGSSSPQRFTGADAVTVTDRTARVHVEDGSSLVRVGLYPQGLLATADVALPSVAGGVSLPRDFLRVVAVDLGTYLPGSRASGDVDAHSGAEPKPVVRDGVTVRTLGDGVDALHEVAGVLAAASSSGEAFLVSPDIATTRLPGAGTSATSSDLHWPAHPAPPSGVTPAGWGPDGTKPLRSSDGVTATWGEAGSTDVLVTLKDGAVPAAAFVRVFPRRMVFPDQLASGPSVVRGDGAATVAPGSGPVVLRLKDPLALGPHTRPSGAQLNLDLLVVPRPAAGPARPRLLGGFSVPIGDTPSTLPMPTAVTDFDETDSFSGVPVGNRAVSHAGVLGFPRTDPLSAVGWPTSGSTSDIEAFVIGLVESLGDEGSTSAPRDAPRMPTMGRRESVVAARSGGSSQTWHAVVGGGWLTPRSRAADQRQGNPGWPAQGERDATAVSVQGQLAYDLARAALRRARGLEGRMAGLNDDTAWSEPPAGTDHWAGAVLSTVAGYCETPSLALVPDPTVLPADASGASWTSTLNSLPAAVRTALSGVVPTKDRAFAELRHEGFAAKFGRRDAQWALKRAIGAARELVYIEAPRFGASTDGHGRPQDDSGHDDATAEWDIVDALVSRLSAVPALRVVLAVPKLPDLPPQYEVFALFEYQARKAAYDALVDAGGDRVTMLHAIGFPGRPLLTDTTVVCVDDVWLLVGTSSPTRRGFTFDGAVDVALLDRQLDEGYSAGVRAFRRALMARLVGASAPRLGETSSPAWVRLARPVPAAVAFAELTNQEAGNGLVEPLYVPMPVAGHDTAQSAPIADPDGRNVATLILAGVALLGTLETLPAT